MCVYCVGLRKWVEVGNSGMFRPEMLLPMGLPREVSVIAWGVSLERCVYVYVNVHNRAIERSSTLHSCTVPSTKRVD